MAIADTRDFSAGNFSISAPRFQTGFDFSVFDHLKYIGVSTQTFAVPVNGKVTFSSTIEATAYNTDPGRIINGTYIQSGLPYAAATLEGQQAGAVMNMIDFSTGQLFDWFISGRTAFALIERLPSTVTNPGLPPGDPAYVGLSKAYTQIIAEVPIAPGKQDVAIAYSDSGKVEYFLNGVLVAAVDNVGVPLDVQGLPYTGIYPALGPGEPLAGKIRSLSMGHGLFSLLDAFPFQHPERPDLAVSIPLSERLFGQGMDAIFDNFTVTTNDPTIAPVPGPGSWGLLLTGLGMVGAIARRRRATAAA